MTEPGVASSDATNIAMDAKLEGDEWVLNGEKWWSSGAGDPRCSLYIVMAVTDPDAPRHARHSMLFVPAATKGIEKLRAMTVYGSDDAPHGHLHVRFTDVRVPEDALILGRGRGFEIAQGRLGPGRIHHCMRAIGQAERALEAMCRRSVAREAFGQKLASLGANRDIIAEARMSIEMARLLCLKAAWTMDTAGRPRRGAADFADQGGGAARRAGGDRPGGADARRRRRQPGFPARADVDLRAHAPPRRRSRRRASARDRQERAEALLQRRRDKMSAGGFPEDTSALDAWAAAHVAGFVGPSKATKFATGQSNPTYLIENPSGRYVLRRKPPGKLLKIGAYGRARISRDARAGTAQGYPAPRALALCEDESRRRLGVLS